MFSKLRAALGRSRDQPVAPEPAAPAGPETAPELVPDAGVPAPPSPVPGVLPAPVAPVTGPPEPAAAVAPDADASPAVPPSSPVRPLPAQHEQAERAEALGLRARIAPPVGVGIGAQPHVLWGTRGGFQVFVRLGVDEVGEGLELLNTRGLRQIVVVRAAFPTFQLHGKDGTVTPAGGSAPPPAVATVLAELDNDPARWNDLVVVAGPEGLVTSRPQLPERDADWTQDLRLVERLVAATSAEPLLAERIGPAWKVPYGVAGKRRPRSV